MPIVLGKKDVIKKTPGGVSNGKWNVTTHNHDVGDGGLLLVSVAVNRNTPITWAKYNGVRMTQVFMHDHGSPVQQRNALWVMYNPPPGAHALQIKFSNKTWIGVPVLVLVHSFTGTTAYSPPNTIEEPASNTPTKGDITIENGSYIYAFGQSSASIITVEIPEGVPISSSGGAVTELYNVNINSRTRGGLSNGPLTGGTYTLKNTNRNSNERVTLGAYEIRASGSTPPTPSTTGNFLLLF